MEPQIRYVRSADGTTIATYTIGESRERPTLIFTSSTSGLTTPSTEWQVPSIRGGLQLLAERRKVVKFDLLGTGLSARDVMDFSIEALVSDIDAIAAQASEDPVDFFAATVSGPIGIAFAARRPDRVRRLVLWDSVLRGRDFRTPPLWRATGPIAEIDWEFFLRIRAMQSFGWTETARRIAEAAKGVVTPASSSSSSMKARPERPPGASPRVPR